MEIGRQSLSLSGARLSRQRLPEAVSAYYFSFGLTHTTEPC